MSEAAIPRRMNLSVQYACSDADLPTRADIRRWLRGAENGAAQLTVRFVDREEGQALNRDYRDKDYATNVLSFPYEVEPILCGDLVLCWPVLRDEALAQGKSLEEHAAHLIVHGCLHLQGFDHETDAEAAEMEGQERAIVQELGYADPYAGEER